ncbi:hypothetical protein DRQ09_08960 [candidate division KSB1 bacterium]|nr:MAG: hypothetical protein DRQ09_08960 [candidate division KSB1 bacterium]
MKFIFSIFFLIIFSASVSAQNISIYGYFEPQFAGFKIKKDFLQINSNKLRIDLSSEISDKVSFGANFDYITYHGQTAYEILNYLPESVTKEIPDDLKPLYILPFKNRNFLDNAYLKLSFKSFDITVGKQQISMGTGYTWNPTDVFNVKNVFDPTYEQPGHNSIRIDIPIGLKYSIVALYAPANIWRNSGKLIKFKGKSGHFDYSFIFIERMWTFTDYLTFQSTVQKRRLFGGDLAGQLFGLGVWAEAAFNRMRVTRNFWEVVAGADYTFDSGTYLMFEYYRNTLCKTNYRKYNITDWMRYISAEVKAVSRDNLFIYVNHPATDLINTGCYIISSLNDLSVAVVPLVIYNVFENVDLTLFGNFYTGKKGTTYSSSLGNGGLIRLRYYF